jgi:hypothetical protein
MKEIRDRMMELMAPINQQILMCDDDEDMLMMACAMLQRTNEIFEQVLGKQGAKKMFKNIKED